MGVWQKVKYRFNWTHRGKEKKNGAEAIFEEYQNFFQNWWESHATDSWEFKNHRVNTKKAILKC